MGPTGPWLNRHDIPPSTLLRDNIIILRAARGHRSTGVEEKGETLKEGERAEKAGVCHARWPTMSRELGPFVCQTIGAAAKTTRNNRPLFRIGRGYREEKGKGRRRRRRRQVFRGWWRWLQREREREGEEVCLWPLEISLIDWPRGESTKLSRAFEMDDWMFDYETIVKPREILCRNYSRSSGNLDSSIYEYPWSIVVSIGFF